MVSGGHGSPLVLAPRCSAGRRRTIRRRRVVRASWPTLWRGVSDRRHGRAKPDRTSVMQVIILGSGSPLPDPPPGRSVHPGAHDGRRPPVRLWSRRGSCGRRRRRDGPPACCTNRVPHPPAQRPRHRPQRRHHHALGDVFAPSPLRVVGPGGTPAPGRAPRPCWPPTSATGWTTTPTSPGRRRGGGQRSGETGVGFEQGAEGVRSAPTDHAPVRPTVGYRVDEGGGSWSSPGTGCPAPGWTSL